MTTPDKIYVSRNFSEDNSPHGLWYLNKSEHDVNVEYIRKDALIEWLKIAVECYSHPDTVNVVDTIRCEGKKWGFQDVINKLNSM